MKKECYEIPMAEVVEMEVQGVIMEPSDNSLNPPREWSDD